MRETTGVTGHYTFGTTLNVGIATIVICTISLSIELAIKANRSTTPTTGRFTRIAILVLTEFAKEI